jgi:hypothetical protein
MGGPGGMGMGGPGMGMGGPGGMQDASPEARSERRAQFMEGMLRQMDANGDGVVSPNEVDPARRAMFERMTTRLGMDPAKPIAINSVREAVLRQAKDGSMDRGGRSSRDKPSNKENGSPAKPTTPSSVPGFGEAGKTAAPGGFGTAAATASTTSPTAATGRPSTPQPVASPASPAGGAKPDGQPSAADKARVEHYAESIIKRYDTNKNGVLDRDEIAQLSGPMRNADRNGDGVITKEELVANLSEFGRRRSDQDRPAGVASSGNSPAASSGSRKTLRFLDAQERLPKGLPEWFYRRDADGDGQVSMAEYASVWTDAMAEEFSRYDLNGDGIVTPEECGAALKRK